MNRSFILGPAVPVLLMLLLGLFPAEAPGDETATYTIQAAAFGDEASAVGHFTMLEKKLKKKDRDRLRIEHAENVFRVRIGAFQDRRSALSFLKRLKPLLPNAIVLNEPVDETQVILRHGALQPGATKQAPSTPKAAQGRPGPKNRSVVIATVREIAPMPLPSHCLAGSGAAVRLVVAIESADDVAGYENYLREMQGKTTSVVIDQKQAADIVGKRIRATVEYKGDDRCRLYWVERSKVIP